MSFKETFLSMIKKNKVSNPLYKVGDWVGLVGKMQPTLKAKVTSMEIIAGEWFIKTTMFSAFERDLIAVTPVEDKADKYFAKIKAKAAVAVMAAVVANKSAYNSIVGKHDNPQKRIAEYAVGCANALIQELKNNKTDGGN